MRQITVRHLLGGFSGGVGGILAFRLLHPALMAIGCLLGVVLGYWNLEILREVRHALSSISSFVDRHPIGKLLAPVKHFKPRLGRIKPGIAFWARVMEWTASLVYFAGIGVLVWLVYCPYLRTDPFGETGFPITASREVNTWITAILIILLGAIQLVVFLAPLCISGDERWTTRRDLPRELRRRLIQRWGLGYIVVELLVLLQNMFLLALGAVCFTLVGTVALVGLMLACIGALILVLARSSARRDHWLCFAVTLIITTASAFALRTRLEGMMLYIIALGTGTVSGLVSEAVRRAALTWSASRSPRVQKILACNLKQLVRLNKSLAGKMIDVMEWIPIFK